MSSKKILASAVFAASALLTGMVLTAAPAAAQGAKCASNPLVGVWRLDAAKSKIPHENADVPGRLAVIAPSGADGITALFVADGDAPGVQNWTAQFDGKPYSVRGVYPRQMEWHRADCNSFDVTLLRQVVFNPATGSVEKYFKEPQVAFHDHIVVSADGMSFSDTRTGNGADQTLVFNRQ